MLHARTDYNRFQDPADNHDLLRAYADADAHVQALTGPGTPIGGPAPDAHFTSEQTRSMWTMLGRLVLALAPTLGSLITKHGPTIPGRPIGADEPVWLLRAQDKLAPETLRVYAEKTYARGGGNLEMARAASEHASAMEDWQNRTGFAKSADAPPGTLGQRGAGGYPNPAGQARATLPDGRSGASASGRPDGGTDAASEPSAAASPDPNDKPPATPKPKDSGAP